MDDNLIDESTPIKRSAHGMQVQIMLSAAASILVGLVAAWFFERLLGWTSGGGAVVERITWIIIILLWVISSLKLWFDWKAKRYEIAPDSLIVHAKAGGFGTSQTIYRYESIISVRMTQGFLGKQFGYGDVRVTLSNIDKEIVMNDIEYPIQQVKELQRRMAERSGANTAAFVN